MTRNWPPLTAKSRWLAVFWWIVCLNPPVNLLLALVSGDRAVAGAVVTIPLAMGALLMAPVVVIRAAVSTEMNSRQKLLAVLLGLSVFPMFGVVSLSWWLGSRMLTASPVQVGAVLSVLLLWLAVMVVARSALRREPTR